MKSFFHWLKSVPVQDPVDHKNAPLVQLFFLFTFGYLFITKGVFTFYELRQGSVAPPTLVTDTVIDGAIALAALLGFMLIRHGRYRPALRTFVSVLLFLVFYNYVRVGAQSLFPTPLPVLILAFGGLLLGRRDMWWIYAALMASLICSLASDYFQLSGSNGLSTLATERIASIGGLYTMSAIIFDGAIRALRQSIAEARQRAEELAAANRSLAYEMEERREAQRRLLHMQKIDTVNRTAAGVAHDFDNLLSVILGYAMQREAMADAGPEELKQGLASVERVARKALDTTEKLLSFSRMEDIRPTRFSVDEALQDIAPMLNQLFESSAVASLELDAGHVSVEMDRHQFDVMVLNLAANARDAMAHTPNPNFVISTQAQRHEQLIMTLADNGAGISPAELSQVFDPFFTTKPPGHGTGLGLSAVSDIVRSAGGKVILKSSVGIGTTVRIELPVQGSP